jgi:hypothetical protein
MGVEGAAQGRTPALRRAFEAVVEAWRERASEKRAAGRVRPLGGEPRLRRSRLGAALEARLAVRSGVRVEDFLRNRLAKYAGRLPVPLEALPVTFDVEGGEVVVRPRAAARRIDKGPRPEQPAGPRALVEREGPYAAREIRDAETALDQLDASAAAARARLEAIEVAIGEALASGKIVAAPLVEATPEQLGRPPVPSGLPILGIRAFVASLLVAEAWRFSAPILAASGIAPDALEGALRANPLPAALALAFAVGAAAAAFTFAAAAAGRAAEAISLTAEPRRRFLLFATASGAALLVPGVAAAAAAPERWPHLALLALVPFAGALLWRAAASLARARATAEAASLEWDRARAVEALERGRHEEVRARAAARLAGLEAERAQARRKVQKLHRLAVGAERSAELTARSEGRRLDRLSEGLACALELDRYLYVRLSSEQVHVYDERPARPPRLEHAVSAERFGVAG